MLDPLQRQRERYRSDPEYRARKIAKSRERYQRRNGGRPSRVPKIYVGARFGTRTIISRADARRWNYLCDCGRTGAAHRTAFTVSRSCGCLKSEYLSRKLATHGHSRRGKRTRTYRIWRGMMRRSFNRNDQAWKDYGGRGIVVCPRWCAYQNFLADMGEAPDTHSIDRINNDAGYAPGNCRWADRFEQAANKKPGGRTTSPMIEINGQRKTRSQWARLHNISRSTLRGRLLAGWDMDAALSVPPAHGNSGRTTKTIKSGDRHV